MKTKVEISWDKPEDQNWLCAGNIQAALSAHCTNTKFEVKELSEIMKELTKFELDVISTIAKYHPFSDNDVKDVYLGCKSFDTTIKILELSISLGIGCFDILIRWSHK